MASTTIPKDRRLRMVLILREAETRYRHEILDEEERCELHSRIIKIKKKLAATIS